MYHYVLYTMQYKKELLEKLGELEQEETVVSGVELESLEGTYKISCKLEGASREMCSGILSHLLSDLIQKQSIYKVCKSYLKTREDLNIKEKQEITQAFVTNNYLSRQEGFSSITYYLIYVPILQEINEEKPFHIDGWLQFRIKKYQVLLKDILEQFVLDYSMKKEVVSFIKLMRDISLLSVPLEEVLHIIYNQQGKPSIYNSQMKAVTGVYIRKYCKELLLDSTLKREDLILHVLIMTSPKKLVIHSKEKAKQQPFLKTLEIIFDENIEYCKGCKYCQDINNGEIRY